jgi:hypothetical protein
MPVLPTWRPVHGWRGNVMMPHEVEARFGSMPAPCPFCGSKTVGLWMGPTPHMTCGNCGADGPAYEGKRDDLDQRQQHAFTAWQNAALTK